MNPINASTERFEAVEILTVPGLFTTQRVDRATVPSRQPPSPAARRLCGPGSR